MPVQINTRVTPALHPENVMNIEGYDDIGGFGLNQTVAAFTTAYTGIAEMWSARDTVSQNGAWTEERRIVELSKLGERKFAAIAKAFDSAREMLMKQIKSYENELTVPVTAKAASSVAAEIRRHVKELPPTERNGFVQRAMTDGDGVTLTALLGAPSYLSGLSDDMQKVYVRQYRERMEPETAKRLKVAEAAAHLIADRGGLVFDQLEKAVGASPQKAAELRRRHEAATKVLA